MLAQISAAPEWRGCWRQADGDRLVAAQTLPQATVEGGLRESGEVAIKAPPLKPQGEMRRQREKVSLDCPDLAPSLGLQNGLHSQLEERKRKERD